MKLTGDGSGDLALNREHICQIAIVSAGPNVGIVSSIDQLRIDPHLTSRVLYTALNQVSDAQRLADSASITCHLGLVLHDGRAADYSQVRYLRQIGENLILNSLCEIDVLFVA